MNDCRPVYFRISRKSMCRNYQGQKIVFKGTIRELQTHFYTWGQCEVDDVPYQLANMHYIKIK